MDSKIMDSKMKTAAAPTRPAEHPADDIDLELVLIDPVYRRKVIDSLNAERRPSGGGASDPEEKP